MHMHMLVCKRWQPVLTVLCASVMSGFVQALAKFVASRAVRASSSIPFVFDPVEQTIGEVHHHFVDGDSSLLFPQAPNLFIVLSSPSVTADMCKQTCHMCLQVV